AASLVGLPAWRIGRRSPWLHARAGGSPIPATECVVKCSGRSSSAATSREGRRQPRSGRGGQHRRWGRGRVSHAMPKEKKGADRRGRPARSGDELTTTASCQGEKATACQDQRRRHPKRLRIARDPGECRSESKSNPTEVISATQTAAWPWVRAGGASRLNCT